MATVLAAAAVLTWPWPRVAPGRQRPPPLRGVRSWRPLRTPDPTAALLQVLEAVAAQVRGGAVPLVAWDAAVDVMGADARQLPHSQGEPLPDVLRQLPGGNRVVTSVAAAWSMADDVGAPLADVLDQLAAGLRTEADVDAEVEASLAAPRATARLLAGLPVAGVGLGELIGAGPVHVLVSTPWGRLSGIGGIALAVGGHLWTRRLVTRAASTR